MAKIQPINLEEKVAWVFIVWTYAFYLFGMLYAALPVLVWWLGWRHLQQSKNQPHSFFISLWWLMAFLMLLALIIGHIQFDLGLPMLLKSTIGWAKGWALFALLIGVGISGMIRPELLARACSILCIISLAISPFLFLSAIIGLPTRLYVSPVSLVGGPGPDFFAVNLYGLSPDGESNRLMYFAPWAPAISMVANVLFWITRLEKEKWLRNTAFLSVIVVILLSASRLGILALVGSILLTNLAKNCKNPNLYLVFAIVIWVCSFFVEALLDLIDYLTSVFTSIRADSSKVRYILASIAVNRWFREAFWFGHGNVELGPHLVEFMPIGSHHTWYGLLFIKGFIGFIGLFLSLIVTFYWLGKNIHQSKIKEASFGLLISLIFFSFGENLEILVYLIWPGWVFIGTALRNKEEEKNES